MLPENPKLSRGILGAELLGAKVNHASLAAGYGGRESLELCEQLKVALFFHWLDPLFARFV
ncbi:hypothetical protein P7K49_036721 [Saguinus oedipus]|uniref:Uncharacterized protein n=1 Tax=Saguinus oedipus TaxID=9490 RepID=A0ABQ9TL07_SAGOE|nr:hypothetical protein P7K49_036721 [Saguinus oedipus]